MKFYLLAFLFTLYESSFSQNFFVTLNNRVWTVENLSVSNFRNGDIIPQAKTTEEWKVAGKNQEPAWCYYENNEGNGEKFGKLYNWYAVNDRRGLVPKGFW
jgi:uncharacterized protein (TIGR02145 family)